jgi:hypothetical protein
MVKIIITKVSNCHECKYCNIPLIGDFIKYDQCTNIYKNGAYCD